MTLLCDITDLNLCLQNPPFNEFLHFAYAVVWFAFLFFRYVICRWELSKVKKKHTHIQNKVASTLAEIMKVDHRLQTLRFVCDGANVLVNDKEASSSESYEDISEAESEEGARR